MAMADVARPVLQELHEPDDLLSLNARKPADALKTPVAPIRHKRPRLSLSPPPPKRRLCLGLADSPPPPPPRTLSGIVAARYEMREDVLGTGRCGAVRMCARRADGVLFAAKTLGADAARREAQFLRACAGHANVCALDACFGAPPPPALAGGAGAAALALAAPARASAARATLVLELAHGGDLFERVIGCERGVLPEPEARCFSRQLLRALAHVHARGVVHNDVKLENCAVARDGTLKLLDFGLAARADDLAAHRAAAARGGGGSLSPWRRRAALVGTPQYMAPELLCSALGALGASAASDVWAAGVASFAMLCGEFPVTGTDGARVGSVESIGARLRALGAEHADGSGALGLPWDALPGGGDALSDDSVAVLRAGLTFDAACRPSAADVLRLRWFTVRPTARCAAAALSPSPHYRSL